MNGGERVMVPIGLTKNSFCAQNCGALPVFKSFLVTAFFFCDDAASDVLTIVSCPRQTLREVRHLNLK
jgi:hypothetical protein